MDFLPFSLVLNVCFIFYLVIKLLCLHRGRKLFNHSLEIDPSSSHLVLEAYKSTSIDDKILFHQTTSFFWILLCSFGPLVWALSWSLITLEFNLDPGRKYSASNYLIMSSSKHWLHFFHSISNNLYLEITLFAFQCLCGLCLFICDSSLY